jgi:hypothetical protein
VKRLNWRIIKSNIDEAREELQKMGDKIAMRKGLSEEELKISLEHAYHHLNCAWNVRHMSKEICSHV